MYIQNVYKICFLYTKCAKLCTKYIQIGCYGGGFLLAKPPPSTTQNGMFLSYNHHKNLKNNISIHTKRYTKYFSQHTKCLQNITISTSNVCIVYKIMY